MFQIARSHGLSFSGPTTRGQNPTAMSDTEQIKTEWLSSVFLLEKPGVVSVPEWTRVPLPILIWKTSSG